MKNNVTTSSANPTSVSKLHVAAFKIIFISLFGLLNMSFQLAEGTRINYELAATTCPTADFTASNNGCPASCPVFFTNLSNGADSYHWDFGDGNSSTEMNPQHVYENAGTYTVTLRATGEGCQVLSIGVVDIIAN